MTTTTTNILLARGTTPAERKRSIDTLTDWARTSSIDPDTIETLHKYTEDNASTVAHHPSSDTRLYINPGTETAYDRQGPDEPAAAAVNKAATSDTGVNLIVDSLANIDIDTISRIVTDYRVRLHDATHELTIHPTRRDRDDLPPSTKRALEVLSGTADHADALLAGIEWNGGRPPIGCTSKDGRLAPADNYDEVCRVLQQVRDGKISKTRAAGDLGCARKTIDNALDRPELYRLD
jgi:hypothetical protein